MRVNDGITWLQSNMSAVDAQVMLLANAIDTEASAVGVLEGDVLSLEKSVSTQHFWLQSLNETLASHLSNHTNNCSCTSNSADIVELQQSVIAQQSAEIETLQADMRSLNESLSTQQEAAAALIEEQQTEIDDLQNTVHLLNDSLVSLTTAVEQMMKATTFTTTLPSDCTGDGIQPCHLSNSTTLATGASTVTEAAAVAVSLAACYEHPCSDQLSTLAWDKTINVVATVDADDVNAVAFNFSLTTGNKVVWTHAGGLNKFTSFVPSNLALDSLTVYQLSVDVELEDGRKATGFVDDLMFAAPPLVHGATVDWVNDSAAINWFEVTVNATDLTELLYSFWVVDNTSGLSYLAVESSAARASLAVASTRNFTLDVAVTNAFGSTTWCQDCGVLAAAFQNVSTAEIFDEIAEEVQSEGDRGADMLIAALDVVDDDDELLLLLELFDAVLNTSATSASQDVVVLYEVVDSIADSTTTVMEGVLGPLESIAERADEFTHETLELYLDIVDTYNYLYEHSPNITDTRDHVADLDDLLATVCVGTEIGDVPDGTVATFEESSFSLSCASTDQAAVVDSGSAVLTTQTQGIATVTITEWNNASSIGTNNDTALLSAVYGVSVDYGDEDSATDAVDVDDGSSVSIEITTDVDAVRKAVSCKYYDRSLASWSERGVVIRGLEVDVDLTVMAICATSHFTLFTVEDSSEVAQVVESKIQMLSDRVAGLNTADLLADNAEVNWLILGVCIGATVAFAVFIVVAKVCGRSKAVHTGLLVFQKIGVLSKPNTMGTSQYEAVLRRWVAGRDALKLIFIEVLTSNSVIGFLFHWDHEAVVFGRADKAVTLFGAVLMTFVSSAFLFNPNESSSADPLVIMWSAFVSAALTNILLLPVQHFLPYMVSNVNAVTTFTPMPVPLLKRELRRLTCWRSQKHRANNKELRLKATRRWMETALGQQETQSIPKQQVDAVAAVSTKLRFFKCAVDLPSALRASVLKRDVNVHSASDHVVQTITTLQRRFRRHTSMTREARRVEFEAWYTGMQSQRHVLAALSSAVLIVLAMFTLTICVLLSVTFNADESVLWITDVGQSLVVQVFVTDPAVTLAVIVLKLFASWLLLKFAKARARQQLANRMKAVSEQIATVYADVDTVTAKIAALNVMASGNAANMGAERSNFDAAKAKCEAGLRGIALAKSKLFKKLASMRNVQTPFARKLKSDVVDLERKETSLLRELKTADAALQVLNNEDCDTQAELQLAHESLSTLRRSVTNLTQFQHRLTQKQQRLEDKTTRPVKPNAILPVFPGLAREEPAALRAAMPTTRSANARHSKTPQSDAVSAQRRLVPADRKPVQKKRRHKSQGGSASRHSATAHRVNMGGAGPARKAVHGDAVVSGDKPSKKPLGGMSWRDLRATKEKLAKKAARRARSLLRGRKRAFRTRSPKLLRAVLASRERAKRQGSSLDL